MCVCVCVCVCVCACDVRDVLVILVHENISKASFYGNVMQLVESPILNFTV